MVLAFCVSHFLWPQQKLRLQSGRPKAMTMKTAYRIGIARDRATYIVRADSGRVDYMSGSGVPLALSNLVGCAATELRFQLEDAKDGKGALARVDKVLTVQWSGIQQCNRSWSWSLQITPFSDGQHSGQNRPHLISTPAGSGLFVVPSNWIQRCPSLLAFSLFCCSFWL